MFRDIARPPADWLRPLPLHIDATALRQLPHLARFTQLPHTFRQAAARKTHSILLENAVGGESHLFSDPVEVFEVRNISDMENLFGRI